MVLCYLLFIYSTVQCMYIYAIYRSPSKVVFTFGSGRAASCLVCVVPMESSLCYEFQDVYLGPGLQGHRTQGQTGTEAPHWGTI
jgi:hypothetical protein